MKYVLSVYYTFTSWPEVERADRRITGIVENIDPTADGIGSGAGMGQRDIEFLVDGKEACEKIKAALAAAGFDDVVISEDDAEEEEAASS